MQHTRMIVFNLFPFGKEMSPFLGHDVSEVFNVFLKINYECYKTDKTGHSMWQIILTYKNYMKL